MSYRRIIIIEVITIVARVTSSIKPKASNAFRVLVYERVIGARKQENE